MGYTTVFLVLAAVLSLLIGLAVLARDYKKIENVAFFSFSVSIASWSIGILGFLRTTDLDKALVWAKFYYFAPLLLVYSCVIFTQKFLYFTPLNRWINRFLTVAGLLLVSLLLFDKHFVTSQILVRSYGKQVVLNTSQYLVYSSYLLVCFVVANLLIYTKFRNSKKSVNKQQAGIFFAGFAISCVIGVFFNLLLPGFGNYSYIAIGPPSTAIFLLFVAYAIVRHRLFDVRLVVARTLGYASSLVFLVIVFGLLVFGSANLLFNLKLSFPALLFLSVSTGIVSIIFGQFKKKFDKVTSAIFYQDAYDPQKLFDDLNKVLVSTVNLDLMLKRSSEIIATNIKASYCAIGLQSSPNMNPRIVGTQKLQFPADDMKLANHWTVLMHKSVVVVDDLDEKYSEFKDALSSNNIAVLVRLSPDIKLTKDGIGYIVIGSKRSGNPFNGQDIRVLDTIAKELIIAIQNALRYEEIENFSETLQAKVDESTRKLRRSNEKLKALDETKDDFISMASHQMRTPLTSIKGYLSMVLEEDAGKITPMQREMLGQAFFSSQRMVYLIADLLNVSRLKTGKFLIEASPVNLADMVEQELKQLEESAASRSLTLRYDKPDSFPEIMLDETKTRQVIMNFVDNSIYYTPAGGHIEVKLIDRPNSIELRVEDDGIGVAKDEQHHLFTKFYRAGNARKARPDGTGLGLYMAKKVIAGQNGSIIFESEEGKGSTFGFVFGKARLEPTPSDGEVRKEPAAMAVRAHLVHHDK
ncbi:hypothetical protein H7171_00675 [Candidatus Saccharibacteria bacterium]|nr:hypothetical protein [Candidatus Saccharibacteria bacterium]